MNIENIRNQIIEANKAYRSGTAIITDAAYDALLEIYSKSVPVQEYDAFLNTLHETAGKVKHPFIMGSLSKLKVQEPDTVLSFIKSRIHDRINVSAKVDGISCRLSYRDGRLVSAATRGDGEFGESLDDKIKFVKGVVGELAVGKDLDIRGELVILRDDFLEMSGFSNPRNACAGIMNRKVVEAADIAHVTFIPYTVLGDEYTKAEQFKLLEDNGFTTAWHRSFDVKTFLGDSPIEHLTEYAMQDLPYEIDGVVISDDEYWNEDRYRPENQVAVKTNTLAAATTFLDIEWVGPQKDGGFNPVAVLEPVELGGSVISRATANNLDYIEKLGLKYGSKVELLKSGDIIPRINSVIDNPQNAKNIEIPTTCPCCGSKLVRDGVNMRCLNSDCRDQKIFKVMHFIKKLGVMNASFKTLESFGIDSYEKLRRFVPDKKYKNQVKLYGELDDKIFSRSKRDIFCALNMRGVGETLQNKIVDHLGWNSIEESVLAGADPVEFFKDKLTVLPDGIGSIIMDKFMSEYMENAKTVLVFAADSRWHWTETPVTKKQMCRGSVCFTGSLNTISRSAAAKLAESAGYEVKSGVSKGLTYLVTNDVGSGSFKNKKAAALGIAVIDEKKFLSIMKNDEVETDILEM